MAQLKDLIVTGATRLIGDVFTNKVWITSLADSAGNTGTNGQVLKSDGNNIVWGSLTTGVSGVKGNAESAYRTGQVNLTAANVGAPTTTGSGASGTWGISISGNAATASKLGTATVGGSTQPIYLNAGVPTAATSYANATVGTADKLTGFSSRAADFTWGNQTGTAITVMNDSSGGSLGFRKDNPTSGQMSMVIDGTVYIKEGTKNVGDAITSITRSGTTFTYTTLWGNTGTFSQQDNNTWNALSTSQAGYVAKAPNDTTKFLRGDAAWATPPYPVTSVAGKTGAVTLGTLKIGDIEYNGSSSKTIGIADLGLATAISFLGVTSTDVGNSTYSNTATVAIVGGSNATASNGSVVIVQSTGEEYVYVSTGSPKWQHLGLATSYALSNHIHGNITNNGAISSASATIAVNDRLLIRDNSDTGKITTSSIVFDGSTKTKALTQAGTWETFNNYTYTLPTASSSTKGGIKVGSGLSISSETLSVSTSSGTSTLAWNSEVTLGTVGGLAIKAKLPSNPNSNTWRPIQVNGAAALSDSTTTLNLKAGANVSIANSSGTVTITATNTTYSAATTSTAGLMSAEDKVKLNGIAAGANAYSLPTATTAVKGGIKVGSGLSISSETLSVSTSSGTSTLAWNSEVTLGTVGGLAIKAKLPSNPNSNTTYTFANGTDGSFTVTPSGGSAQKVTIGKPATAGTADVANSVTWANVSGKPSTFPPSSHTHLVTEITQGNAAVAGSLDPLTQSLIGSAASNKSFGLPANAITIEYSTNGGSTWTDYGATDTQKKALFSETRSFNASLGKATTAAANSVNNQLRITIEPTDRYTSFNGLYIWMSTSGNTVTVDLERSTIGAKDTFTSVFTGQSIAGWSGNNIRYFTYGSFGGGSTQTSNNYKYRLIFKQTAINSNYASASINDIRFLGLNVWSSPNNMVSKNHLYTWNENLDAIFPAQITATTFNGNASSSSAVKDYNNSTLTEFGYSTSGMGSTSWLGSWDASTSGKYRLRAISPANAIKSGIGSTAIGAAGTPIYWNGSNFVAGNAAAASGHTHSYLPLSGGTLTGDLSLKTSTADSPDIVWYYGDTSKEQARIWMGSGGTAKFSPLFRCYKSDGTSLYSGNLVLGDGTGASGTWGISVTGSAGSATKATQDESGNNIKASYAASFSISGHTITLKNKNGGSLGTVIVPDNNTWTAMTGATSSTNGTVGYVNAVPPQDGYNTKYLRADGTWAVPPNTNTHRNIQIDGTVILGNNTTPLNLKAGSNVSITDNSGTVTIAASITNNVTGSGTNGYLAKFTGANTIGNGPALGSATTTYLNNAGSWATPTGDHKVTQNAATTVSGAYPVILANSTATTAQTDVVNKTSTLTYNPNTTKLHTPIVELTTASYGTTLPTAGMTTGQLFFQFSQGEQFELPTGGTTGQILAKSSNANRAVQWINPPAPTLTPSTTKFYPVGSISDVANNSSLVFNSYVYVEGNVLYGAAWNDYAEYRKDNKDEVQEPGRCVREIGDGSLTLTTERLQRGCEIISDTFGFAIGQDAEKGYNTPMAVSGRVLAYLYENIETAKEYIGWPVCSGPNGTVSIMTEEEEQKYPSRIIGTISEIPTYETWGANNTKVNGRIWVKLK